MPQLDDWELRVLLDQAKGARDGGARQWMHKVDRSDSLPLVLGAIGPYRAMQLECTAVFAAEVGLEVEHLQTACARTADVVHEARACQGVMEEGRNSGPAVDCLLAWAE